MRSFSNIVIKILFTIVFLFGIQILFFSFAAKHTSWAPLKNNSFIDRSKDDSIEIKVGTFLGNDSRNYYGDSIGNRIDIIWKTYIGKGTTIVTASKGVEEWAGAGWTGQPLIVKQKDKIYLLQGSFDHQLKKVDAATGEIIWNYEYDDILKGTGSIWMNDSAKNVLDRIVILQGSRKGALNSFSGSVCPSFRAVSFFTGKELWRMNVKQTQSYSRDCDASALIFNDTAYIGLENGEFVRFDPGKCIVAQNDFNSPTIFASLPLYNAEDCARHGGNLVTEASPSRIGNHLYISSGSGHVYGYNISTKLIDWDFYIGSDLDGTPVVTADSCLLIAVEKQYILGNGGIFKLNPRLDPSHCVAWYFPTPDFNFSSWKGGVIGSASLNDAYNDGSYLHLAAFTGIDGNLNVVQYDKIKANETVLGPDGKTVYATPVLQFTKFIGPSISTPIFAKGKLVAAGYHGLHLFSFNQQGHFKLLELIQRTFEASPVADQGRIYIASRDGYLYCLGDTSSATETKNNLVVQTNKNNVDAKSLVTSPQIKIKNNDKLSSLSNLKIKKVDASELSISDSSRLLSIQTTSNSFDLIIGVFSSQTNVLEYEKIWKSRGLVTRIIVSTKKQFLLSIGNANKKDELVTLSTVIKVKYNLPSWVFENSSK